MRLKWAKNFPAFFVIAVFLLFLIGENLIINIIIISGIVILIALELLYSIKYKESDFAYSSINRVTSFIMIPTLGLSVVLFFMGSLYTCAANFGRSRFKDLQPNYISIRRKNTNFSAVPYDASTITVDVVSTDTVNEELLVITTLEYNETWVHNLRISFTKKDEDNVDTMLKYVYVNETSIEGTFDSSTNTYNYVISDDESITEGFKLKLVYETKIKYVSIDEYKGFYLTLDKKPVNDIIVSSDYMAINQPKYGFAQYFIVSADTPSKYLSSTAYLKRGLLEVMIPVYVIFGSIVLLKSIAFIVYKTKEKKETE